ncbi:MAG: L-seryl-tRNA(Sec) selenium transferase [Candidatus Latescibacterota bacterium]|nr:L-seryl-tRNA(Sec) selenium transferase [Candidatus Latescibacterota bacterium]
MTENFQKLPSVDSVLSCGDIKPLFERYRRELVVDVVRMVLKRWRKKISSSGTDSDRYVILHSVCSDVRSFCLDWEKPSMRRIINATGIILHTGLGRAPLARSVQDSLLRSASYTDIEFELKSGLRGSRVKHVNSLLCQLCSAEAVAVVNNNAAAVILSLQALALDREVLVSRGQLVEIGGSFRIPDIIEASGARLHEVGTTNRTHLTDYASAINENTGALLIVHPSNFRVCGFTAETSVEDLAQLAQRANIPLIYDLGGGALFDLTTWGLPKEPVVSEELARGADIVTFSADKVLGGPQAGLIAGRSELVDRMVGSPLMRALRCDKLTYAALSSTLTLYRLNPALLAGELPVLGMLTIEADSLFVRAEKLFSMLEPSIKQVGTVISSEAHVGSGALPLTTLPSWAIALQTGQLSVEKVAKVLRGLEVPIVGRIESNRFLLDMRTVQESEIEQVASALNVNLVPLLK